MKRKELPQLQFVPLCRQHGAMSDFTEPQQDFFKDESWDWGRSRARILKEDEAGLKRTSWLGHGLIVRSRGVLNGATWTINYRQCSVQVATAHHIMCGAPGSDVVCRAEGRPTLARLHVCSVRTSAPAEPITGLRNRVATRLTLHSKHTCTGAVREGAAVADSRRHDLAGIRAP